MCQLVSDSRDGIRWTIVVLQNYQAKHEKRRKFNFISSESVAGVIMVPISNKDPEYICII